MASEANKHQVDGSHYKTAYEHWDYALDAGLGVLEYAATKHLGRYHKKGEALNDLQKARHYVVKLMENITVVSLLCPRNRLARNYLYDVANKFIDANEVPMVGADDAIVALTTWQGRDDLQEALSNIDEVIRQVENGLPPTGEAKTVPLEDSNKHALQKQDDDNK